MKTIAAKLFVSVLFGLLLSSALYATDYGYTEIDVPNASLTIARGINARGDIIGNYVDADGVDHDFLLHKGVFSNIDYPGRAGAARAINARGDIAEFWTMRTGRTGSCLVMGNLLRSITREPTQLERSGSTTAATLRAYTRPSSASYLASS